MAKARSRRGKLQAKPPIATNWDVLQYYPFKLEGEWLVADRTVAQVERSSKSFDTRRQLHRQLANPVGRRRGEAVLTEGWPRLALEFANTFFPPVVDTSHSGDYRVSVARFGEEALLMWWMIRLRLELARGPREGDLNATLRAALQVSYLASNTHEVSPFPLQRSPREYDATRWIGLFAGTLQKPQRLFFLPTETGTRKYREAKKLYDGAARFLPLFRPPDRPLMAIRSLPRAKTDDLVEWLRVYCGQRSSKGDAERCKRLKETAIGLLYHLWAARYGRSVRRLMQARILPSDLASWSLGKLNQLIRQETKRTGVPHLGVLALGSGEDPEQELWHSAARTFVSVLGERMTGAIFACYAPQPLGPDVSRLTVGFRFMTPLARIWFDFWKDLGGMLEARTCEVCGDPFAARTRAHRFCCQRCRKTAEMRRRRRRCK